MNKKVNVETNIYNKYSAKSFSYTATAQTKNKKVTHIEVKTPQFDIVEFNNIDDFREYITKIEKYLGILQDIDKTLILEIELGAQ